MPAPIFSRQFFPPLCRGYGEQDRGPKRGRGAYTCAKGLPRGLILPVLGFVRRIEDRVGRNGSIDAGPILGQETHKAYKVKQADLEEKEEKEEEREGGGGKGGGGKDGGGDGNGGYHAR